MERPSGPAALLEAEVKIASRISLSVTSTHGIGGLLIVGAGERKTGGGRNIAV